MTPLFKATLLYLAVFYVVYTMKPVMLLDEGGELRAWEAFESAMDARDLEAMLHSLPAMAAFLAMGVCALMF